jgi:putative peptide zinc metalloprotease protein
MTLPMRRLSTAFVLVFALFALLAGTAPATSLAQDNTAVAINTTDDSSLFELAFSIKEVGGEVVDQTNAAVAYSSCQECQTVAIAIQVLIVTAESPGVVMPTNLAVAVNENCDTCTTMALAYQFVVGGQGLELTRKGRHELDRIRRELQKLGKRGLTAEEIRYRTAALVERLKRVLATELVPRRSHHGREGDDGGDRGGSSGDDGEPPPDEQTVPDQPAQTDTTPQATTPQEQPPQSTAPQQAPAPQQPDGTTTTP